jgi:hypothetical protein
MQDSKLASSPMVANQPLSKFTGAPYDELSFYHTIVGGLQ